MATTSFPDNRDKMARRPTIRFSCDGANSAIIILPMPGSLQFGDGASYNNAELGVRGNLVAGAAASAPGSGGDPASLAKTFDGIKDAGSNASVASILQGIASTMNIGENVASAISIGTGTTLNKNITTEFTATNTRVFSFAFQLISTSISETAKIREIVNAFRLNLYPEGDELQLKYPPKWDIKFLADGGDIPDIPKIGKTYLTEVSTTFNGSANMWRTDGSPLETSIQLQFMETKAYRRDTLPK
jgi:hypothetical protein